MRYRWESACFGRGSGRILLAQWTSITTNMVAIVLKVQLHILIPHLNGGHGSQSTIVQGQGTVLQLGVDVLIALAWQEQSPGRRMTTCNKIDQSEGIIVVIDQSEKSIDQ